MCKCQIMIYRRASRDDLPAIDLINRKVLPENYPMSTYIEIFEYENSCIFVADEYGITVGYIIGAIKGDNKQRAYGEIISIGILENYRRQGLGQKLISKMETDMKRIFKIGYCELHVRKSNKAAIQFYNKLGFFRTKKVKNYYKDEDGFIFRKNYGS